MQLFLELFLLLFFARLAGEVAERFGYGASVGEITVGILLGLSVSQFGPSWSFLGEVATSDVLTYAANAGIFFLVLMAGIEMQSKQLTQHSGRSFAVALGGMLVPLLAGFWFAWEILPETPLKQAQALLVGVALSISAIPATVKVFRECDLLHTQVGETVVAAAVIDDVLGIVLLAILTSVIERGAVPGVTELLWILLKVAFFFVVTVGLGSKVYPAVSRRIKRLEAASHEFSTLILVSFAYCLFAEFLGIHWIIGAFMAGLYFEPAHVGQRPYVEMKLMVTALAAGLLGPLFFVSIGLRVDMQVVTQIPLLLSLLIGIALAGKIIGAGMAAYWGGFQLREATIIGVGLSARGAMELIILSIAQSTGVFSATNGADPIVSNLFSALVLMAAVTTMLAPLLLRGVMLQAPR